MSDDRPSVDDMAKQRQTDRLLRALVSFMLAFAMVALYYVVRHN